MFVQLFDPLLDDPKEKMGIINELCCGPWMGTLAKAYSQGMRDLEVVGLPAANLQHYEQVIWSE
jgi:hypothetical protein